MSGERKVDESTLDRALELLDHELAGIELDQPLQIRAVGGYAMLKHGLRADPDRALTADIDSLTQDYSRAVRQAIADVGEKLGIDRAWLNNDAAAPEDMGGALYTAMKVDAHWQDMPEGSGALKRIDIAMADIATLTRMKIAAVDDGALSDRAQDLPDLDELLAHQGITSMAQFRRAYPDPDGEYPRTAAVVSDLLAGRQRGSKRSGSLASALGRGREPDTVDAGLAGAAGAAAGASAAELLSLEGQDLSGPEEDLSDEALLSGFESDPLDHLGDFDGYDPWQDSGFDF